MRKLKFKGISSKEFFSSLETKRYIHSKLKRIEKDFGVFPATLSLHFDKKSTTVAYTNNFQYVCNTGSRAFEEVFKVDVTDLEEYLKSVLGVLFHEVGHRLFTNFSYANTYRISLESGILAPLFIAQNKEEEADLLKTKNLLSNYDNRSFIISYIFAVNNCIEDMRMERCLFSISGKYSDLSVGLKMNRENEMKNVESFKDTYSEESATPYSIVFKMIYQISHFGDIELPDCLIKTYGELKDFLMDKIKYMISLNKAEEYYKCLNEILVKTLPLILEEQNTSDSEDNQNEENSNNSDEKKENENSQGDSNSQGGDFADNNIPKDLKKEIENTLENLLKENNINDAFEKSKCSKGLEDNFLNDAFEKSQSKLDGDKPLEGMSLLENRIKNQIKEDQKNLEIADKLQLELQDSIELNEVGGQNDRPINLNYQCSSPALEEAYDLVSKDIKRQAKKLVSKNKDLLLDVPEMVNNQFSGTKFNVSNLVKDNFRNFGKKVNPCESSIAIGIALDESGSMIGDKYHLAKKVMLILEEYCTILNIPLEAIGFNSTRTRNLYIYSDIEHRTKKDKYKIMQDNSKGGNRDGLALNYIVEKLKKVDTDHKLIFMISDGQPSEYSCFEDAIADISMSLAKAKKENIHIVAVAIDEDAELIEYLYKDQKFLDITDLNLLPKRLTKIINNLL